MMTKIDAIQFLRANGISDGMIQAIEDAFTGYKYNSVADIVALTKNKHLTLSFNEYGLVIRLYYYLPQEEEPAVSILHVSYFDLSANNYDLEYFLEEAEKRLKRFLKEKYNIESEV